MQDRFLTRYYDTETGQIIRLNTIINTCENGIDIEFYGICVSGDGQISQVELDKNEQRFIRMQCTGLKDKNGKLIYEGDIGKDDHEALHQVKWCYNCFLLKPCFKNGYTLGIVDDEIEIIGNIYENPELIGGAEC